MFSPARSRLFVCLSVCKIIHACMDLDEMLRVDCRPMSGHGRTEATGTEQNRTDFICQMK